MTCAGSSLQQLIYDFANQGRRNLFFYLILGVQPPREEVNLMRSDEGALVGKVPCKHWHEEQGDSDIRACTQGI